MPSLLIAAAAVRILPFEPTVESSHQQRFGQPTVFFWIRFPAWWVGGSDGGSVEMVWGYNICIYIFCVLNDDDNDDDDTAVMPGLSSHLRGVDAACSLMTRSFSVLLSDSFYMF